MDRKIINIVQGILLSLLSLFLFILSFKITNSIAQPNSVFADWSYGQGFGYILPTPPPPLPIDPANPTVCGLNPYEYGCPLYCNLHPDACNPGDNGTGTGGSCTAGSCPSGYACITDQSADDVGQCTSAGSPTGGEFVFKAYLKTVPNGISWEDYFANIFYDSQHSETWSKTIYPGYDYYLAQNIGQCVAVDSCTTFDSNNPACLQLSNYGLPVTFGGGEICEQPSPSNIYGDFPRGGVNNSCISNIPGYQQGYDPVYGWGGFIYPIYDRDNSGLVPWGITYDVGNKYRWNPTTQKFYIVDSTNLNHERSIYVYRKDYYEGSVVTTVWNHLWCRTNANGKPTNHISGNSADCSWGNLKPQNEPGISELAAFISGDPSYWTDIRVDSISFQCCEDGYGCNSKDKYYCRDFRTGYKEYRNDFKPEQDGADNIYKLWQAFDISVQISGDYGFLGSSDIYDITDSNNIIKLSSNGYSCSEGYRNDVKHLQLLEGHTYRIEQIDASEPFRVVMPIHLPGGGGARYNIPFLYPWYPSKQNIEVDTYSDSSISPVDLNSTTGVLDINDNSPIDKILTAAWTDLAGNNILCSGDTCWKYLAANWKNAWADKGASFDLSQANGFSNAPGYNLNGVIIKPWSMIPKPSTGNNSNTNNSTSSKNYIINGSSNFIRGSGGGNTNVTGGFGSVKGTTSTDYYPAGPTTAWSNGGGFTVCNHNVCWNKNADGSWGTPLDISQSRYWTGPNADGKDYTVKAYQGNKYPWSDFGDSLGKGPTSGWNTGSNSVVVCNRTICWLWKNGINGGWDDNWTRDMKNSDNWQAAPVLPSNNKIYDSAGWQVAWNGTDNHNFYVCRNNECLTWIRGVNNNWSPEPFDISTTNLQQHLPGFNFNLTDFNNKSTSGFSSQAVVVKIDPSGSTTQLDMGVNSPFYPTGNVYIGHAYSFGDYGFETGDLSATFPYGLGVSTQFIGKDNVSAMHKEGGKFLSLSAKSAVINPGFEGAVNWTDGIGWDAEGSGVYERYSKWRDGNPSGAKYGSYSLHIKGPTNNTVQRVIQWVPLYYSTKVRLSAWLKGRGGGGTLTFDEYCTDANGPNQNKGRHTFSAGNSNSWGYHNLILDTATDCTSDHRIAVFMDLRAGEEIWADDISVSDKTPYIGSDYLDVGLRNLVNNNEPLTFSFWARSRENFTTTIPILSEPIDANGNYNWAVFDGSHPGESWADTVDISVTPEWKFYTKTFNITANNLHTDKVRFNLTTLPYGSIENSAFSTPIVYYDDINIMRGNWESGSMVNSSYAVASANEKTLIKVGMERKDHTPNFTFSGNQCLNPAYDTQGDSSTTGDGTINFANHSTSDASSFDWTFGDGDTASQLISAINSTINHTYLDSGTYTVTLTAHYSDGTLSNFVSHDITIYKPTVSFTTNNLPDYGIEVSASPNPSPNPYSLSYSWDFPSASPTAATGQTTTAQYSDGSNKAIDLEMTQTDISNTCYAHVSQNVTPTSCPTAPTISAPNPPINSNDIVVQWNEEIDATSYTLNYDVVGGSSGSINPARSPYSINNLTGPSGAPITITVTDNTVGCTNSDVILINLRTFPWYQISKGDSYSEKILNGVSLGAVSSVLPDLNKYLISNQGFISSGVDSNAFDDHLLENICSDPATNQCLAIESNAYADKEYNYNYFANKLDGKEQSGDLDLFTSSSGIYKKEDNVSNFGGDISNKQFIYLVHGSVNITSNINASGDDIFILIASGDINIDHSVTKLDGFYIADGKITTGHNSTGFDEQLTVNGGLISWDENDGVDLQRDLGSSSNADTPAEIFNENPNMLDKLYSSIVLNSILISPSTWQEVSP